MKGHSGNKWNDRADRLADQGVRAPAGGEDATGQDDISEQGGRVARENDEGMAQIRTRFEAGNGRAQGNKKEPRAHRDGGVRWVTYNQTTTRRVEKASTGFGTLNMQIPRNPVPPAEIAKRMRLIVVKVRREMLRGEVDKNRADAAVRKLNAWKLVFHGALAQRKEITAANKRSAVRSLECDINVEGLETYAATMQKQASKELRWKQINAVLGKARSVREGLVRLPIDYAHSPLGRAFREAGHLTGSREYAIGVDPFKGWPKHLRRAAFHEMGWECDDAAAYPTARQAMVPPGREVQTVFLEHREEIFSKVGETLFSHVTCSEARRDIMKKIFAAYDNDATLDGWVKNTPGLPRGATMRGVAVKVGEKPGKPGIIFKPEEYWKGQQQSSMWMWENAGEDLREFMNDRYPKKGLREKRLLWKSYVLQEAEAVGRDAKIAWAVDHGIPVHSLQHDCVFLGKLPGQLIGRDDQKLADALSKAVTDASGYAVKVQAQWTEKIEAVRWVD